MNAFDTQDTHFVANIVANLLPFILSLLIWFVALFHAAINKNFKDSNTKLIWILVIIFTSAIGAIIYLLFGRPKKERIETEPKKPSENIVEQILENTPALPPHKYPIWVKLSGVGIIIATIYSLILLPKYLVAAKKMHAAQVAYQSGNYDESIQLYRYVLEAVSTSRVARIGTAEAIFSNSDKSDDEIGLTLLKGVTLNKDAWARITKVMPVEYQLFFNDVKK